MCAPIPKGKWAWKYDRCVGCKTKKIKHKGRGLCLHCFDRERDKKPERKAQVRASHKRFHKRFKARPNYKEIQNKHAEEWRKNPESGYQVFQNRQYRKLKFKRNAQNIILGKGRQLKRNQGIKIICKGCPRDCQIVSPIKDPFHRINDLKLFKQELVKVCQTKLRLIL